jgi:hypothetical protein
MEYKALNNQSFLVSLTFSYTTHCQITSSCYTEPLSVTATIVPSGNPGSTQVTSLPGWSNRSLHWLVLSPLRLSLNVYSRGKLPLIISPQTGL